MVLELLDIEDEITDAVGPENPEDYKPVKIITPSSTMPAQPALNRDVYWKSQPIRYQKIGDYFLRGRVQR